MGDLVLSFPLESWLSALYPDTPIWVVGEPVFYQGLIEISPPVTYFSYSDSPALRSRSYSLLVNLSHRPEAAALASSLRAEQRIGPYLDSRNRLRIGGDWQLYRSSVSHNNRHNLFHWADLNALDLVAPATLRRTAWPLIKKKEEKNEGRIGLFVGASEREKRPDPSFWANLAARLIRMEAKPVFLGGKEDREQASEAARLLHAPAIDLSGKFSIIQLCRFIGKLDLLIAPDTGPMHIAAWMGVPSLNLSLGPVNAWETGPFTPGLHVLRSSLSCAGCWNCAQKSVRCKSGLSPEKVAIIARLLLENRRDQLASLEIKGSRLLETQRDPFGLFHLEATDGRLSPRLQRSLYWKYFFGRNLGYLPESTGREREILAEALRAHKLGKRVLEAGQKLLLHLSRAIRNSQGGDALTGDFWQSFPPLFRPLSSYIQLLLHNEDFSPAALNKSLELTEACMADLNTS